MTEEERIAKMKQIESLQKLFNLLEPTKENMELGESMMKQIVGLMVPDKIVNITAEDMRNEVKKTIIKEINMNIVRDQLERETTYTVSLKNSDLIPDIISEFENKKFKVEKQIGEMNLKFVKLYFKW